MPVLFWPSHTSKTCTFLLCLFVQAILFTSRDTSKNLPFLRSPRSYLIFDFWLCAEAVPLQ